MRLIRLNARNLHRQATFNRSLPVSPVMVLHGPNESGKSTLIGLIALALNGPSGSSYPVLGDSPTYPWLANAVFDDGTQVTREMAGEKHAVSFNGSRAGGLRATQASIDRHLGQSLTWSIDTFLAMTPAKRLTFLETEVLHGAGWLVTETRSRLTSALSDSGLDLQELLLLAGTQVRDTVRSYDLPVDGPDGRPALIALINRLREVDTAAHAEALRLGGAVKTDDQAELAGGLPAGTVSEWEVRRGALDIDIGRLREKLGKLTAEKEERDRANADLEGAIARVSAGQSFDHDGAVKQASVIEDRERVNLKEAEEALASSNSAVTETEAALLEAKAAANAARDALGAERESIAAAAGRLAAVEALNPRIVGISCQLAAVLACPADELNGEARSMIEATRLDLQLLASGEPPRHADTLHALADAVDAAEVRLSARSRGVDGAKKRASLALQVRDRTNDRLANATMDLTRARDARSGAAKTLGELSNEVDRLRERVTTMGTGDTSAVDESIVMAEARRKDCIDSIRKLNDAAGERAARVQRRADLLAAQDRRTQARAALAVVVPVLETLLSEAITPFSVPVNRITRRVLGADVVPSFEGGFTFHLVRDGVDLGPGSRSVQAVSLVALRIAVMAALGGWRAVVLDDMENLGESRRSAFLEAMVVEVAEARLDNFLGACVSEASDVLPEHAGVEYLSLHQ